MTARANTWPAPTTRRATLDEFRDIHGALDDTPFVVAKSGALYVVEGNTAILVTS